MRAIFLLVGFFFTTQLFAQNYIPFPEDSATWSVAWYSGTGTAPNSLFVLTGNDTLINGKCYNQLYSGSGYFVQGNVQNMIWGYSYSFAYRNDVPNKKVYKVDNNEVDEYLWYDFDLKVGDTIKAKIGKGLVITRIDSIVAGFGRKYFTNLLFRSDTTYLIEGAGNIFGLNTIMGGGTMDNYTLLGSFKRSGSFGADKRACDPLNVVEKNVGINNKVEIFPNPSTGTFSVSLSDLSTQKLSVYDAFGRLVLETNSSGKTFLTIEMPNSSSKGIYFLELKNGIRTKFVIQ